MNKEFKLMKRVGRFVAEKTNVSKSEAIVGLGLIGFGVSMWLMHESTKKASKIDIPEDATKKEKVKAIAPAYIYPAVAFAASTVCVVTGVNAQRKTIASLTSLCTFTATAYNEYKDKVVETVGEKKEKEIRQKVYEERMDRCANRNLIFDDVGGFLCYDPLSNHFFRADRNRLRAVVDILNQRLDDDGYVSLNDFYYEMGIGGCELGNWNGWTSEFDGKIDIDFVHDHGKTYPVTGENAALLMYYTEPRPGYDKYN